MPCPVSLIASTAPLSCSFLTGTVAYSFVRKTRHRHPTAKVPLSFLSANAIPDFNPPVPAFLPSPKSNKNKSPNRLPFKPRIRFNPLQENICLLPARKSKKRYSKSFKKFIPSPGTSHSRASTHLIRSFLTEPVLFCPSVGRALGNPRQE